MWFKVDSLVLCYQAIILFRLRCGKTTSISNGESYGVLVNESSTVLLLSAFGIVQMCRDPGALGRLYLASAGRSILPDKSLRILPSPSERPEDKVSWRNGRERCRRDWAVMMLCQISLGHPVRATPERSCTYLSLKVQVRQIGRREASKMHKEKRPQGS